MSEIKLFPGPFLYIEEIENHFQIKQKIVSLLKAMPQKMIGPIVSKELK